MNALVARPVPGRKLLVVPGSGRLAAMIPHSTPLRDGKYLAVPHKQDEVRLLRNLGFTVPSPIEVEYNWASGTPFAHQRVTAALLADNKRAYVLNGMGSGKTRAALYALDYLMRIGEVRKALIVAPLSTLTTVWEHEVFMAFPHLNTAVLHGTRAQRIRALQSDAEIYVINHDGIHTILAELTGARDIDCVIIDELAAFRNARTRRWKALSKVLQKREYAWGLTGLPTPNAPTDAWAQARLLTPWSVPKFFKQWQQKTMRQITQFKWAPKPDANTLVHQALQPAVRFATEDCIDLPPSTTQTLECKLTKPQQDAYKNMMTMFHIEYASGKITAANEGVKLSKLMQISAGFIYDADGKAIYINNKPRLQLLLEILRETEQKVIVFVPFTAGVRMLHTVLSRVGISCEMVYGDVPKRERDRIFSDFMRSLNPRVIVAHPATMSHGLTLTAASTIVWFSLPSSYEIYDQANARIARPGQKFHTNIIHIVASKVEARAVRRLESKQSLQGALLELFEGEPDGKT